MTSLSAYNIFKNNILIIFHPRSELSSLSNWYILTPRRRIKLCLYFIRIESRFCLSIHILNKLLVCANKVKHKTGSINPQHTLTKKFELSKISEHLNTTLENSGKALYVLVKLSQKCSCTDDSWRADLNNTILPRDQLLSVSIYPKSRRIELHPSIKFEMWHLTTQFLNRYRTDESCWMKKGARFGNGANWYLWNFRLNN